MTHTIVGTLNEQNKAKLHILSQNDFFEAARFYNFLIENLKKM